MDELKWNWVYIPYLDAPDKQKASAIKAGYAKVYFKSEADAVIAEKDKEIAKLKDECLMHDFFWEGCGFAKRGFKNAIAVREAFDRIEDEKIEELEEHIDELQKATDYAWSKVNVYYDELRHHKYKRCLAMAKLCYTMDCMMLETAQKNGTFFKDSWCWKRALWYGKWKRKWLALAENLRGQSSCN